MAKSSSNPGIAIGNKYAPTYGYVFMNKIEE